MVRAITCTAAIAILGCAPPLHAAPAAAAAEINVKSAPYGARCDWNGTTGTDDTAALTAAAAAATAQYTATGKPVRVRVSGACKVTGRVEFGSGVHWVGPGTIVVPDQTHQTFYAHDADHVSVEGLTFKILYNKCGNQAACSAIYWGSTLDDTKAHTDVVIRNNIILHSNWGVLISYNSGSGSLSDVEIAGNYVKSPSPYMDADAIHVGGRISNFLIHDNRIENRGDAGVAATSETSKYICSGGTVENNVLIQDRVGLDNSGCKNVVWRSNFVRATAPVNASNPAFRSILYLGVTPTGIVADGNYLQNGEGFGEYAAKIDDGPSKVATNAILRGNTMGSLYLRGSNIQVEGNTFLPKARVWLDYDGPHAVKSSNILIGANRWLGGGRMTGGANPGLMENVRLAPQLSAEPVTLVNRRIFTPTRPGALAAFADAPSSDAKAADPTSAHRLPAPALGIPVLHGRSAVLAGETLAPAACKVVNIPVAGATREMFASADVASVAPDPQQVIAWAYVKNPGTVEVKLCAPDGATLRRGAIAVTAQ